MTSVLGTPLAPLGGDGRPSFLVSDLHLGEGAAQAVANLVGVLQAARAAAARVLVLGDLFDAYVSARQVHVGVWRDVAAHFAAATSAGTEVVLLPGNRDYLLGSEFVAASGVRLVAGGLRGVLAGADTVLLHGDELCQNDLPYQRAKRWLRHPLTRAIARRLPLRLALRAAERARAKSQQVVGRGDPQRFLPTLAALGAVFATGAGRLVFGHIHRFAHGACDPGEYWVLPAFDATAVGLEARGDRLRPVRFDASGRCEPVPVPDSCPFAA
ncbi:MAG: metallophosphoesterase [Planctomycetes bacterium]|nr:metallophosphoesterase [Planctomycetota bacterium]